jgi:hypothetical protein
MKREAAKDKRRLQAIVGSEYALVKLRNVYVSNEYHQKNIAVHVCHSTLFQKQFYKSIVKVVQ